MNETNLAGYIALLQPPHLPFSDHVHGFISGDRLYRALHRTEPQACGDALLDEPVVLLNDIVQIRNRPAATTPAQFTAVLQYRYGVSIGRMAVHVDHPRANRRPPQRHLQKMLRGHVVPFRRQHEINRVPFRINVPVQVRPLPGNANVSLIHPPGATGTAEVPANPRAQFRGVTQDPARDGGMVQAEPALGHQFLQVPVAEGITQIPPNGQEDDIAPEMSPSEQLRSRFIHRSSPYQTALPAVCDRTALRPIFSTFSC